MPTFCRKTLVTKIDKKLVLILHEYDFNGTVGGPTISLNKGDTVQTTLISAGYMAHNFGIATFSKQSLDFIRKTNEQPLTERMINIPYEVMAAIPRPGCVLKFAKSHINSFILSGARTTFVCNVIRTPRRKPELDELEEYKRLHSSPIRMDMNEGGR